MFGLRQNFFGSFFRVWGIILTLFFSFFRCAPRRDVVSVVVVTVIVAIVGVVCVFVVVVVVVVVVVDIVVDVIIVAVVDIVLWNCLRRRR